MTRLPTADDVARALVAACRETGDDPLRAASGDVGGTHGPNIRGRHYALHALLHVFQDLSRTSAATYVGCPGKPLYFYNASWNQIVKPRASGLGHMANWWDDSAYARVIAAIEAHVPAQKFRLVESLDMRRRPSRFVDDVTANLMGDPSPDRSALAERLNNPPVPDEAST